MSDFVRICNAQNFHKRFLSLDDFRARIFFPRPSRKEKAYKSKMKRQKVEQNEIKYSVNKESSKNVMLTFRCFSSLVGAGSELAVAR